MWGQVGGLVLYSQEAGIALEKESPSLQTEGLEQQWARPPRPRPALSMQQQRYSWAGEVRKSELTAAIPEGGGLN